MIEVLESDMTVAGHSVTEMAAEFGTPLVILDQDDIQSRMRAAVAGLSDAPAGSRILYASKALGLLGVLRLAVHEGLGLDVVSSGEVAAALRAGAAPDLLWWHGNAKSDQDLAMALQLPVGRIVVDNADELARLREAARAVRARPPVILRLAPPAAHLHKFGFQPDEAEAALRSMAPMAADGPQIMGFHIHMGAIPLGHRSRSPEPFLELVRRQMAFAADVRERLGYWPQEINVGGGFGIAADPAEPALELRPLLASLVAEVRTQAGRMGLPTPRFFAEPGRSLVGPAGLTVYTVQSVKTAADGRGVVAVDGGVGDNPRPMLYGADAGHPVRLVARPGTDASTPHHVVGRYCDAHDVIRENVPLDHPARGDLMAVLNTGAYCVPLSSQYNRVPRPPVVLVSGGQIRLIMRRETLDDLFAREID